MEELLQAIKNKDVGLIKKLMDDYELKIVGNKIVPKNKNQFKKQYEYWDMQQHIRKILLNSLYGALLNPYCRFYDKRIGQSVTLTGRCITKHMASKINEILVGEYDNEGAAIQYGDTDSSYFSIAKALELKPHLKEIYKDFEINKDNIVQLYNAVAEVTNESFTEFLINNFNVNPNFAVIKAKRELVASKALFITKKRYALLYYDKEGSRKDKDGKIGELKAMGLDLKRADTPKYVQKFLEEVLLKLLSGSKKEEIVSYIKEFRKEFKKKSSWEKGTPKRVNKLSDYANKLQKTKNIEEIIELQKKIISAKNNSEKKHYEKLIEGYKKIPIPGHVMASINYNKLRELNGDKNSQPITDGGKVIVCKLKNNIYGMNSIAYPVDQYILPEWFKKLPFDDDEMEATIIDKKLSNLLSVLGWDLSETHTDEIFDELFS